MNDPHVAELKYQLKTNANISYKPGATTTWETSEFDGEMTDGVLTLTMKSHHATVGSAQNAVQPFLEAWQIQAGLQFGLGCLEFEYKSANVIDRNPPPPGAKIIQPDSCLHAHLATEAKLHETKAQYPTPPSTFSLSPLVTTLWQRYRNYLEGKEPLASMGYFCLTVLEADAGKRKDVESKFSVHKDVLSNLGRLTSAVGDDNSARKISGTGNPRSHTSAEIEWIKAAIKLLIQRAGEIAINPGGPHDRIEMSDLPTI